MMKQAGAILLVMISASEADSSLSYSFSSSFSFVDSTSSSLPPTARTEETNQPTFALSPTQPLPISTEAPTQRLQRTNFPITVLPLPTVLQSDVADLEAAITQAFGLRPGYNEPCEPCPLGDRIGELVRLTFHDGAAGRSNGCIDFDEPHNAGLQPAVARLLPLCNGFVSKGISVADCYVVAGALAIRYASTTSTVGPNNEPFVPERISQPLLLPTRFGRPDEISCSDIGLLPHADDSWATMQSFFVSRFRLTNTEIVAIMGAHTLGRAEKANLGFEGGWTNYQASFSNLFYVMMVARDWRRDCVRDPDPTPPDCIPHQWREPRPHLALTVDVELVITPTDGCNHFGAATPTLAGPRPLQGNVCPLNGAGIGSFQSFAEPGGTQRWWALFASAWKKVTESGHKGLQDAV